MSIYQYYHPASEIPIRVGLLNKELTRKVGEREPLKALAERCESTRTLYWRRKLDLQKSILKEEDDGHYAANQDNKAAYDARVDFTRVVRTTKTAENRS